MIRITQFNQPDGDKESDEEGCPAYEGDSDSPGNGDGSTGEGV